MTTNYHDWVYWLLMGISILSAIYGLFVLFSTKDFQIFFFIMVPIASFIVFFGWLIAGSVHSVVDVNQNNIAHVIKTPTSIILTIDDKPVKTITDIPAFNYLSDKTNIMLTRDGWINIYGTTNWRHEYSLKF